MKIAYIAEFVGGEVNGDGNVEIDSVADISRAGSGQIAFYEKEGALPATEASCVITKMATLIDANLPVVPEWVSRFLAASRR
jgi:UDP-3-O-[3-hydroxymyristoyl] glucosamine N-acyltransferase